MAKKWEVIVYTESERITCDTEEEADSEADRQNRIHGALTRTHEIEVEDEEPQEEQ